MNCNRPKPLVAAYDRIAELELGNAAAAS